MVLGCRDPYFIVLDGWDPNSSVLDGGAHNLWYLVVVTHI